MTILLTWAGYDVCAAANAEEALKIAEQESPALILLDIGMPICDGYDACKRMRASATLSKTRIFAVSGFSGEMHERRCDEAGFTGRLTKPLDPEMISRLTRRGPPLS